MQIFLGKFSGARWSQLIGLTICLMDSGARGGIPVTLPAVQYINICFARPDGQVQLCRTRYEIGAVHPVGIKEPGTHCRPDTKVIHGSGVGADLP